MGDFFLFTLSSFLTKFGFAHGTIRVQDFLLDPNLDTVMVENMLALRALHERPLILGLVSIFVKAYRAHCLVIIWSFLELVFFENLLHQRFTLLLLLFLTHFFCRMVLSLLTSSEEHLNYDLAASVIEVVSIKLEYLLPRVILEYLDVLWNLLLKIVVEAFYL